MRPDKPQFWRGGGNIAMTEITGVGRWEPIKNLTARTLVDVNIDCRGMLQGVARVIQDGEIIDITTSRIQKNIFATPSQFLRFETLSIPTGTFTSSGNRLSLPAGIDVNPIDILFNNDGMRLYALRQDQNRIIEYNLSTPYDITTAIGGGNIFSPAANTIRMIFNNDGTKFFILRSNGWIIKYNLTTPYDVSTATSVSNINVSAQDTSPKSILFNNDGAILYVLGDQHNNIFEYNLTTPYDVSTATYTRVVLGVSAQDTLPRKILFNNDGTKLYLLGEQNDRIYEYNLTTPYDVSTATYTRVALGTGPQRVSMTFSNNGVRLYLLRDAVWPSGNHNTIFEYLSGTIWTGNVKIRTINN